MKAVVLAGGKGTRMGSLTKDKPKVMLKINEEPILERIIRGLRTNGIKEIILVVNYKKEKIIDYFGDGSDFGVKIDYVTQEEPLGTADALRYAKPFIDQECFLALYGDHLFDSDVLSKLKNQNKPTICVKRVRNPKRFGVVDIKGKKIKRILEKTENPPTNLANTGIYLLPKEIFDGIEKTKKSERGEYELTDSIQKLIDKGIDFDFLEIQKWQDIGTKESLKKARSKYKRNQKQF